MTGPIRPTLVSLVPPWSVPTAAEEFATCPVAGVAGATTTASRSGVATAIVIVLAPPASHGPTSTWLRSFSSTVGTRVPFTEIFTVSTATPMFRYAPALLGAHPAGSVTVVVYVPMPATSVRLSANGKPFCGVMLTHDGNTPVLTPVSGATANVPVAGICVCWVWVGSPDGGGPELSTDSCQLVNVTAPGAAPTLGTVIGDVSDAPSLRVVV